MRKSAFHHARPACLPVLAVALLLSATAPMGCTENARKKAEPPPPRYPTLPPKANLPEFMKGTIFEVTDVQNKEPYPVYGYGMVVGLDNTGDNTGTSQALRNFMIDEMVRHGFGSHDERLRHLKPEAVVRDPRTAIVEVYGYLPPGARANQRIDVYARAATGSQTRSLARGTLYRTNLYAGSLDSMRPARRVNTYAIAQGPVFVNPASVNMDASARSGAGSLRTGTILNGGMVVADRPIKLRVRTPQLSVARSIEVVIDQRFADDNAANTLDEGYVDIFVPHSYRGDWEHFVGVVTHLYVARNPALAAVKGRLLAAEAVKPDAPLMDISYCFEALGPDVIPFVQPLYTHASPDVAFAAARAGAFVGDAVAEEALLDMARSDQHAFQLNAVKTLGALPPSTRIERMMNELVASSNALVRIEAYRVLADQQSPAIISLPIRQSFVLDRVPCNAPAMVYATRTGVPRIALFGQAINLNLPIMFSAMQNRFTISTAPDGRSLVVFDRTGNRASGNRVQMRPDLHELIYRLAGGSDDGFGFVYSELVGILQALSAGRHIDAAFVLQDLPAVQDAIEDAPPIVDPTGRPPGDNPVGGPGIETPSLSADKRQR